MLKGQPAYAGVVPRVIAAIIDYIPLVIISFVIMVVIMPFLGPGFSPRQLLQTAANSNNPEALETVRNQVLLLKLMLFLVPILVYFVPFETSRWQATPGKKLMGLRVTDMEENPLTMQASVIRNIAKGSLLFLSTLLPFGKICYPLAVLWMMTETCGYRVPHDFIAGTAVVGRREKYDEKLAQMLEPRELP